MENYDHDVIGIGNPDHPANEKEAEYFISEDLKECLGHFIETKEIGPLEEAIEVINFRIAKASEELQDVIVSLEASPLKFKLINLKKRLNGKY
jgi:hypothetical protein